jgi:hypothetical protein
VGGHGGVSARSWLQKRGEGVTVVALLIVRSLALGGRKRDTAPQLLCLFGSFVSGWQAFFPSLYVNLSNRFTTLYVYYQLYIVSCISGIF